MASGHITLLVKQEEAEEQWGQWMPEGWLVQACAGVTHWYSYSPKSQGRRQKWVAQGKPSWGRVTAHQPVGVGWVLQVLGIQLG